MNKIIKSLSKLINPKGNKITSYFDLPIIKNDKQFIVNERIIENAFVFNNIDIKTSNYNNLILDVGCTRSYLPIQLSSLGFIVFGIDIREYTINEPNFTFIHDNIVNYNTHLRFDYITVVSTLEHIGLGYYNNDIIINNELEKSVNKMLNLLNNNGKIIITVPIGKYYKDNLLEIFTLDKIMDLFDFPSLELIKQKFFMRKKGSKYWKICEYNNIMLNGNHSIKIKKSRVNNIGCFVWKKILK